MRIRRERRCGVSASEARWWGSTGRMTASSARGSTAAVTGWGTGSGNATGGGGSGGEWHGHRLGSRRQGHRPAVLDLLVGHHVHQHRQVARGRAAFDEGRRRLGTDGEVDEVGAAHVVPAARGGLLRARWLAFDRQLDLGRQHGQRRGGGHGRGRTDRHRRRRGVGPDGGHPVDAHVLPHEPRRGELADAFAAQARVTEPQQCRVQLGVEVAVEVELEADGGHGPV